MAGPIAKQGISILSLSCASLTLLTSSSSRVNIRATSPAVASRKNVAPLLLVACPVLPGRAQLSVSSPRGSRPRSGQTINGGCFDDAVALLASAPVLPKLVVLDLDFTVWPFYCYNRRLSHDGAPPSVYPQVTDIVRALAARKVELAIASRTPSATLAKAFLDQLSIGQHFNDMEIYFTVYSKTSHFSALQEKTGIPYNKMLFFDDEIKNINAAARLGVSGVQVTDGLNMMSLEKGLNILAAKNR